MILHDYWLDIFNQAVNRQIAISDDVLITSNSFSKTKASNSFIKIWNDENNILDDS